MQQMTVSHYASVMLFLCPHPLYMAGGILYLGFVSVRAFMHDCVCLKSCWHDISRMFEWISFKFGGWVDINRTMD